MTRDELIELAESVVTRRAGAVTGFKLSTLFVEDGEPEHVAITFTLSDGSRYTIDLGDALELVTSCNAARRLELN